MRLSNKTIREKARIKSNLKDLSIHQIIEKYLNEWNTSTRVVSPSYIEEVFDKLDDEETKIYYKYFSVNIDGMSKFVRAYLNLQKAILINKGVIVYKRNSIPTIKKCLQRVIDLSRYGGIDPLVWLDYRLEEPLKQLLNNLINS